MFCFLFLLSSSSVHHILVRFHSDVMVYLLFLSLDIHTHWVVHQYIQRYWSADVNAQYIRQLSGNVSMTLIIYIDGVCLLIK